MSHYLIGLQLRQHTDGIRLWQGRSDFNNRDTTLVQPDENPYLLMCWSTYVVS